MTGTTWLWVALALFALLCFGVGYWMGHEDGEAERDWRDDEAESLLASWEWPAEERENGR